jgi:type II secretory ATPase GspE/PulE/Tfp pilus assembly ATPase PilB-like protein
MVPNTKDLSLQLLRLFHQAGLVDQATLTRYAEKNDDKSILDVMTQEVSLETFRDLLTADLSFKRKGRDLRRQLFKGLSASGMIGDQELLQVVANHRPPIGPLIEALERDGVIDPAAAQAAAQMAASENSQADGLAHEALLRKGTVSAEGVCQWLSRSEGRQVTRAALYVTLQLFHFNGLLGTNGADREVGELDRQDLGTTAHRIAREVDMSPAGLAALLNRDWKVPSVDLESTDVDPAVIRKFPQTLLRRLTFLPYRRQNGRIETAMVDPFNVTIVALLEWATGEWPETVFAPAAQILERIGAAYDTARPASGATEADMTRPAAGATGPAERRAEVKAASRTEPRPEPRPARLEAKLVADNLSAVQLVSSLIESAIELRTTDIHIEPMRDGLGVRFRIDGNLKRIMTVPQTMSQPVVSRVKVLADLDVTERRRPQDGHFELNLGDRTYDFRISTLPAILGEKIVIRILDSSRVMTGVETLGMLKKQHEDFEWMLDRPHGMILVTGPTGSGKTSTLYSGLHRLNGEARNLVTIEDPVEYQLAGINQVQVDPNIDMGFAEGLRSILRQDPDVIMVGEIRDGTTAQIAIRAAMTGHLVLSTLHTNHALDAIDTLANLGAARFMVANSVVGIISQRLLRLLCDNCKKAMKLTNEIRKEFNIPEMTRKRLQQPVGCDACLGTGYLGRTGAFEVIRITDAVRPLIDDHRQEELHKAIRDSGAMSLLDAATQKVLDGVTSVDEVRRRIMMEL